VTPVTVIQIVNPAITASIAAACRTLQRCGEWPTTGVDRARLEFYRALALEHRYRRRHGVPIDDNEAACTRLTVRREVAKVLTDQRAETLQVLSEPWGSA
jgi:hypothetical protein